MLLTNFDRSTVIGGLLGLTAISIVYFVLTLIKHRRFYKDLPKPPYSFIFGNLSEFGRVVQGLPSNAHPQNAITALQRMHNLPGIFYVDTWPVADPLLIVTEPSVAAQVTQKRSLPRHSIVKDVLRNLTGKRSIFTVNGPEWKSLRSIFNPGFASTHLNTLVPGIVDHVLVFREELLGHARTGDVFPLEDVATRLTIDVIGQVVLGQNFDAQNQDSPIPATFKNAVESQWNHMDLIAKMRGIPKLWWYCRRLDGLLGQAIRNRYQKRQFEEKSAVIDLALQAYNEEKRTNGTETKVGSDQMDDDFLKVAVDNVKTFILGGHDTTASTISYCYYNLTKYPEVLRELRAEHDDVFSSSKTKTIEILKEDPRKLNALPLTTAVIKETLRLFPPGSTFRESEKSGTVTYDGKEYPTYAHGIWVIQQSMHRRSDLFPSPDSFLPQRFLNESTIPKDAFRPFEKGPRNCIGQELAMIELKIILLLTVREFDFEICYGDGPKMEEEFGGRAYQMLKFSPKPNEGLPVRVTVRDEKA